MPNATWEFAFFASCSCGASHPQTMTLERYPAEGGRATSSRPGYTIFVLVSAIAHLWRSDDSTKSRGDPMGGQTSGGSAGS